MQLLIEKLKWNFNEINILSVIPVHNFMNKDINNFDLILTTSDIKVKNNRVVEIDSFLKEQSINKIRKRINYIQNKNKHGNENIVFPSHCYQLFEPDLIFTKINYTNKNQLLRHMIQRLEEKGLATKDYYQTVINREIATTTAIGNNIAIPHGNQDYINESRIVIGILDKPILWDDNEYVDTVFLLAVNMTGKEEKKRVRSFYKNFIKLVDDKNKKQYLRELGNPIEIYKYFIR